MFNLKKALFGAVSVIFISTISYAGEIGHVPISSHILSHTLELKPTSSLEYQLAKSTFLPDSFDDLGLSGHENTKYDYNKGDNCSGYDLTSCPAHGNCSSCSFNRKLKRLNSCASGYSRNGNSCSASSCSAAGYESSIPANKICTKVTEGSLTCYKDCRPVSCSAYTLNCDTFNVANSSGKTMCPDCNSANANCSPKHCKVSGCMDGFKIADNGTTCVALDDTCPADYFKTCETGTQGDPEYTDKGTACYQCKAKPIENKPQRECQKSPGDVCIYKDGNNNICIGPECSEDEYPIEEDYIKPNCTIAPTYGQWCSKRSCSDDNPLCVDLLQCSEHIAPQCTTMFAWNEATKTCSYYDEQGSPSSCKITGDYSAYECPAGQKCLFTWTDDGDYGGRCVDAGITEADIQKAIVDATQAVCSPDNENADSKLVIFYLGSDNPPSELFNSLDRLKALNSNLLSGQEASSWFSLPKACSQSSYNQCMSNKFVENVTLKSCDYPNITDYKNKRIVNIACEIKQSSYISTFCKMDYCAIDLEKINEYPLSNRTKEILNTYVLHELKLTLLWSDSDFYAADIYTIHADNKTVSLNMNGPNKKNLLSDYLTGCGGCTRHINAMEATEMSINNRAGIMFSGCYRLDNTFGSSCSITNTEYSFIYRMLYNPDTIANYDGTATEAPCQRAIKDNLNGYGYCYLENTYWK